MMGGETLSPGTEREGTEDPVLLKPGESPASRSLPLIPVAGVSHGAAWGALAGAMGRGSPGWVPSRADEGSGLSAHASSLDALGGATEHTSEGAAGTVEAVSDMMGEEICSFA